MNVLTIVAVVVFVTAITVILMLSASLLALITFRLAPSLNGTILALTTSDVAWMLRQMPVYPAWWPGREPKQREKKLVILALNRVEKPEYFSGFDPLHRSMFTPDKCQGIRFDFADRFALEKAIHILADDGLEVFLVFVETRPGMRPILAASRYMKRSRNWCGSNPPESLPLGGREVRRHPIYRPPPMYLVASRLSKKGVPPRSR